MWQPDSIELSNIFSHEHTIYLFKKDEMDMLLGENNTEKKTSSNGSGKSGLVEGISLAVNGETGRGVKKDDFIRDNSKSGFIVWKLHNSILKEKMSIKRTFSRTKATETLITVNGKAIFDSNIDRTKNGQENKIIFDKLGIEPDDFDNYFLIAQGNNNSFFTAGDTKQKEIIGRFANFTPIDSIVDGLDGEIKIIDNDINAKKGKIDGMKFAIETLLTEVEEEEKEFDTFKYDELARLDNIRITKQEKADNLYIALKGLKTTLENETIFKQQLFESIKVDNNLDTKLELLKSTKRDIKIVISNLEQQISKNNMLLSEAIECPKCGERFIPEALQTPDQLKELVKVSNKRLSQQNTLLDNTVIEIEKCEEKILKQKQDKNKITICNDNIKSLTSRITLTKEYIQNYEDEIYKNALEIKQVRKLMIEQKLESKLKILESYSNQKDEIENEIETLVKQKEEKWFYAFHFGKKGLKTYLANKSIKNIQDICNYYLDKLDIGLQVLISGYKTLRNGDLRDKIEISILRNGILKGSFKKYSGGERSRVNLCSIIALNRLINNTCDYGKGLNLLILDENVGYLDDIGQEEVIKMMSKVKITSILIMQNVADVAYKNQTIVVKINGVSRIKEAV